MRIGIYASLIASERGHERNVSGHIQIPLESALRLRDAEHDVHFISTRFDPRLTLPAALPSDMPLHLVDDGRRRAAVTRGEERGKRGIRPGAMLRQLRQMKAIARDHDLDVLHVFGHRRSAMLGGLLRTMGIGVPVVATLVSGTLPGGPAPVTRTLLRRLDALVTATCYAEQACARRGLRARVVRHGIVRDLAAEATGDEIGPRCRVLFWREAAAMNGGDLCLAAFDRLAPRFPDISFDLAIRPIDSEVPGVDETAARHSNIHVYRFPYAEGITLPRLVAESLMIVLPFRNLTVDPQLTIAESLAAGVPVVASDVRSNRELVTSGENGALVPAGEVGPIVEAVTSLLERPDELAEMVERTARRFADEWNWSTYVDDLVSVYRTACG